MSPVPHIDAPPTGTEDAPDDFFAQALAFAEVFQEGWHALTFERLVSDIACDLGEDSETRAERAGLVLVEHKCLLRQGPYVRLPFE